MESARILVVEDDAAIRRGVVDALTFAGHRITEAADGETALESALAEPFDLVLLDIVLPGMTGFEIQAELRRSQPLLPVIMLTARGAESDRVRGLEAGADDYVVKPFSARELLARVEAVLRRTLNRRAELDTIELAGRQVSLPRREVVLASGERRALSETEAGILAYLAGNPGRAVTREELLLRVWGLNPRGISTRTVDMHVARLREKLGDDSADPQVILTVRGAGYMAGPPEKHA